MPTPDRVIYFGFVIEGKGEVDAIPLLTRRICTELYGPHPIRTTLPVRVTKSKLIRPGELERAIRLARINNSGGPVLVVLDADKDCPAALGPELKARARAVAQPQSVSIVLPKYEFETWLLAAAASLAGKRGLREDLASPQDPEAIRGAKEWLSRNMTGNRTYSPSIDQAALAAQMHLPAARSCRSFDRFCREIEKLILGC